MSAAFGKYVIFSLQLSNYLNMNRNSCSLKNYPFCPYQIFKSVNLKEKSLFSTFSKSQISTRFDIMVTINHRAKFLLFYFRYLKFKLMFSGTTYILIKHIRKGTSVALWNVEEKSNLLEACNKSISFSHLCGRNNLISCLYNNEEPQLLLWHADIVQGWLEIESHYEEIRLKFKGKPTPNNISDFSLKIFLRSISIQTSVTSCNESCVWKMLLCNSTRKLRGITNK